MSYLKKFTSRKFIAAAIGIISGLAVSFGLSDGEAVTSIAGAVVSLVSLITYIIVEGRVDATAVAETVTLIQSAVDELDRDE